MDSNVSKKTNSHNFFKLRFDREKLGISVKNLLKQELLLILDLYQQKLNVPIEQKLVINILDAKIAISSGKNSPASEKNNNGNLSSAEFMPIIYACPLGLSLATNLQQSPPAIMKQVGDLLSLRNHTDTDRGQLLIEIEIVGSGWLNFYLNSQFIAYWLERSLFWSQVNVIDERQLTQGAIQVEQTPARLFSIQYIHARCCSLLRLAARENIISLSNNSQQINQPQLIPWLDREQNLWLTETPEHHLLQQLLIVADAWSENTDVCPWSKLALNLSQNTAIFLADCRFLGEVKQQYPQKAIARLGLIALVQCWLEKILVEKLKVAAPREL